MFDLFNVDEDRFIKISKHLMAQFVTLANILIDKKIVTEQEYLEYLNIAEQEVENIFEKEKEKQIKKFKEEYPVFYKNIWYTLGMINYR